MDSFLCTLESLPSLEELKVKLSRSELVAVSVKQQCLLEVNRDKLELFSAEYTDTLKSALEGEEATPQPQAVDREKMWTQYNYYDLEAEQTD